ncbi:MAG: hypothetical protein AAGA05_01215 [Pseudomonadota bacterium]
MARIALWRWWAPALLSLIFATGAADAAPRDGLVLSPDQMRNAAGLSLQAGRAERALAFAEALIARDETDFTALLVRARALRDLNRMEHAKPAARAAWSEADTPEERFAAAMVMAQVQSTAGHKTLAQLWLRRAVHLAPNEDLERRAIRDFKYVRATNPWSTRLSFSITPDSNINNGSSSRTSFLNYRLTEVLFGRPLEYTLNGSARALSGVEYAFGFDTRYRFRQTERTAHDLFFSLDLRRYTLSSEARELAPDLSGDDFAYSSFYVGYGYRAFNFDRRGEYALRADAGQSWLAGDELLRFVRVSALQSYALTPRTRINGRLFGERQFGVRIYDLDTMRLDLWLARFLENGMQLRLAVTGAVATSPDDTREFNELGLRGSVTLAKSIFGADAQFGLGVRSRDYDVSLHDPDGRNEDRYTADITLIFSKIDYYGFNPTVTIYGSTTDSNIGLYDSDRFGVNFGIQSAF